MFTWICPQCGREVPPSYTECPTCAERRQQAAAPPPPAQPTYAEPQHATVLPPVFTHPDDVASEHPAPPPPPPPPQAPPPVYAQQPPPPQQMYSLPQQKKGMPVWMVGVLTVAVLGGGLFGLYKYVGAPAKSAPVTAGAVAPPPDGTTNRYQKFVEVTGVRLLEGADKKPVVRFTVVNHSDAELTGLELTLTLTPTTGGEPLALIDAKVGAVAPQGVKDMESPLATKLKFYELPDWQFVKSTFQITAPK